MIYSIKTIPMVLLTEIQETNDLSLLSDENLEEEELVQIWNDIREDYVKHDDSLKNKKIKQLSEKIKKHRDRYILILMALDVLNRDSKNKDMIEIVERHGYKMSDGIDKVNNQVRNLEHRIKSLEEELKTYTKEDDDSGKKHSIYEDIVNLSVGLEIPLDCNKLTAIEFIYYRKALNNKVKSLNKIKKR